MDSPRSNLADVVADRDLERLVDDTRLALTSLHSEVRVEETSVEMRGEFRGAVLCRVVPYRELLHFQVGENPTWEARLRTESEYAEVMERIVRAFLRALAHP
jgi:hypothetical protein